ncbi:MAG: cell division protein FtsQ [Microgenomates group bacterium LiPW_16]|nr:MAG: cell division protein FtsQ [Microgenomates group bacterium LiPW_16]
MKRRGKKILFKIFFPLFLISLLALIYFGLKLEPFLVKNIVVTTDYDPAENKELVKILENYRGQNIFLVNEKELVERLKSKDIKIKEVKVLREFPGKILVNIEKRQALAAISSGNNFFLVDKEGLVFGEEQQVSGIPVLSFGEANEQIGLQNIGIGSRIDERNKNVLVILDSLKGKEEVQSVTVMEGEIQMRLRGETLVLFSATSEVNTKINALQMILTRFRIEGRKPSKIDLKFEKPVVTF